MIAGATATGGPGAGAAIAAFVKTPAGDALARRIVSNAGGSATPFAMGGLVTEPTFALVGEAGPELITPIKQIKKKTTAYQRKYKKAFKKESARYKLKSGRWKKNGFRLAVKAAHKLAKK